jgi:hypothetical protein
VTAGQASRPDLPVLPVLADDCCAQGEPCPTCEAVPEPGGAGWRGAARAARWLAWASLAWMSTEGAVGLWQGLAAGSPSLTGWALGSAVEGTHPRGRAGRENTQHTPGPIDGHRYAG